MSQILESGYLGLLVDGFGPPDQFQTGAEVGNIRLQGGYAEPFPRTFHSIGPLRRPLESVVRPGTGILLKSYFRISWAGIFNHPIDDMQYLLDIDLFLTLN